MGAGSSDNKKQKKEDEPKLIPKKEEIKEEGITNNAPPIAERTSKKLYNSIFRISIRNIIGTGFFIKLNLKNETKLFLMTCCHIIEEQYVNEKLTITLYYGEYDNEKEFKIKLDKKERFIKCFDRPVDVTLVEIIESDNINKNIYLLPDLNYKNGLEFYKADFFYLAGYPRIGLNEIERSISSGQIIDIIDEMEFEHSLYTGPGNSGSPICLANKLYVVGIHKHSVKRIPIDINCGTFLGYILDHLENENKNNNKKICLIIIIL